MPVTRWRYWYNSQQHAIVKILKSGAELEVLEHDQNKGYSRVRTAGGAEG